MWRAGSRAASGLRGEIVLGAGSCSAPPPPRARRRWCRQRKPLRLLAPRVAVAPQVLDRSTQQADLQFGHGGTLVGFREIGLVRVIARTFDFAVARSGRWVNPMKLGGFDEALT